MANITAIVTTYRRPQNIKPLTDAIRAQSVPAAALWVWANEPKDEANAMLARCRLDRVVACSDNDGTFAGHPGHGDEGGGAGATESTEATERK